ncbi:hypothetical protein EOD42_05700 [Rhodovarius crocodyli]|uniref:Outer membrane protein assembly factor BamE n=1 Tax=Rhodovarius crocodyli TaxID=1979269 RepID=A0A437MPJ7_9PROT|nr:hypothetical protein [Rhodovarius crocodyli]RVT99574.1 hypothetical protein EOD42_05700 [Rhodovarius crocodyli]
MRKIASLGILAMLMACAPPPAPDQADRLTVGTVQREIRQGMSGADVVAVLGAPNMVTSDGQRRETWVYDRISSTSAYTQSGVGGSLILLGAGQTSGSRSTQQRTLTIIIRFDERGAVRDYSYRSTSF